MCRICLEAVIKKGENAIPHNGCYMKYIKCHGEEKYRNVQKKQGGVMSVSDFLKFGIGPDV